MLRIYLLGDFRVERDGVLIAGDAWTRRKTKTLIKLLALQHNRQLHKEQAMDLVWPDLDPTSARDNFYRNLSFLRHVLEPDLARPADSHYLVLTNEILRLGPADEVWIDVEAFEKLLVRAHAASDPLPLLEEAMALYLGDLLPDDPYEEWAIARRDALRGSAIKALFQIAGAYRRTSSYDAAIAALQRILAVEQTDEQSCRELMLIYTLAGRRNDALRQFEQCKRTLNTELGVEPELETTELHNRILKGEITPSQPAKSHHTSPIFTNLPEESTPLIGREWEIEEASKRLRRSDVRLLTLTGTAGIGKTRLALRVAQTLIDDFPDGIYFVPLAPIRDPDLLLPALAQALAVKEAGDRPLVDTLKTFLRDKRILIFLDNFEQIVSAAPVLAQILSAAPDVKLLTTSRELLRLTTEHDFPVSPLPLPDLKSLPSIERLGAYPSIQLFTSRASTVKPDFTLTEDNATAVAEICLRLDGIPLAIELAAARARLLTPQAILARMSNRLRLLTGGARDLPARQQTLYDAIGWSYELLQPHEQTLFARLSIFAGGCTEDAAGTICYESGGQGALDDLSLLLDKSLLHQVDALGGEPRFTMLETIREYASERLAEKGELDTFQARHAQFYVSVAERGESVWFTAEQHYWLERFDAEHHNFRAALTWALEHDSDSAVRLSGGLWRYWLARGYLTEGRRWLEGAIAMVPKQKDGFLTYDRAARAKALFGAGVLATHQSDYVRANQMVAQSLGMARTIGDKLQTANSLVGLGINAHYRGDYDRAVELLEEALPIFRELEHARGAALALNSLSNSVLCQGDSTRAAAFAEESLRLSRDVGDTLSVAASLTNLGRAILDSGDAQSASRLLEESLALRRKLKDKGGVAHTLHILGSAALAQDDRSRAADLYAQSLTLRYEMGDREGMAAPLEGLAALACLASNYTRAARLYASAEALRDAIGAPVPPRERIYHERVVISVKALVDDAIWQAEWSAGRLMALDQAVAYALSTERGAPSTLESSG